MPATRPSSILHLPAIVRSRLASWTSEAYPEEACGCLLGERDGALARVTHALLGRNLAVGRRRDRYELDPADLVRAEDEARTRGLCVTGIWHSHPDRPAAPSETDRASAWEGLSYVILAAGSRGVSAVRSWRLRDGAFHEERLRP